jgi:hypothetical protein
MSVTDVAPATFKETLHLTYSPSRLPDIEGFIQALNHTLSHKGATGKATIDAAPYGEESEGELAKDVVTIHWEGEVSGAFHMDGTQSPIDRHSYKVTGSISASTREEAILRFNWFRWREIAGLSRHMDISFDLLQRSIMTGLGDRPKIALKAVKAYMDIHRLLYMALPTYKDPDATHPKYHQPLTSRYHSS